MKRMIVTLDVGGEHQECQLRIPLSVCEKIEYDKLEEGVKKIFSEVLHCEVVSIDSCEEVRNNMGRRRDDKVASIHS